MAQLIHPPRPLSSQPPLQDLSRTDSGSGVRAQRLRPVGAISPSPRQTQTNPRISQGSKGTRGTPPLRHHDSSPEMLLASLPAHRVQDRRSTALTANHDGSAPSSSRPSLNLLDPDTIVQASNPAHPDHYLWLQRNRTNSPISRRKKVPVLDPDDPALTDSSAGPSCGGHSADARVSLRAQPSGGRLAPSLRGTMLSRPSSSVASLDSSSDGALSVPNTPRTRRKSGDRSPNGTVGSSSDAKAAARKRRRERRERRERRGAMATPPPPPVLPPRVSSTAAREEDNLEGLPPLEKAVYPRSAVSPILPPHPVRTLPIGGRTSSNPALRASAQAVATSPALPLPVKAVRLLGPESAANENFYLGGNDGLGRWPAEEPEEVPDVSRSSKQRGRSASLDLLREHLNFFPQRATSQQTSKPSESSGPSRIRASFDALRPHLMTLTRSNGPTSAPEAEVDSDASETMVIKQKPEGKMRKGLRSIKSVLRLRSEAAEGSATAESSSLKSPTRFPVQSFAQSTQSLDVPRRSLQLRRANTPAASAVPAGSISVPLNFRKLDGWSSTDQRLSFVGEEVDGSHHGRDSVDSGSRTAISAAMTPMPLDATPPSVSPGLTDPRRLSIGRIAPQLQTVPEITHDLAQNSPRRQGDERHPPLAEDNRQWQSGERERSSTEPVKLTGSGFSIRPTNRLRQLPSFNSLRGGQTSATSPPASISAAGSTASSPQYDPASMSRQQGSNGSNGSKGRRGLFTSLWGRGSSTPSSKGEQQSWPTSELGADSSAASFGSTAPTPISPSSGENNLRNVLEQAYTNSYGACEVSEGQMGGRTNGPSGFIFVQPPETTDAMGLGIAGTNRSGARELSAGSQAPAGPFSNPMPAFGSRSTDSSSSFATPSSAKLAQSSNGAESNIAHGTPACPQKSPMPQRSPSHATAAEDRPLDLAFLQADYQHRSALLTGGEAHSAQSTKPQVAIATSYDKDAKTKAKKRSPFLEVVAAGRKSFSKDRARQSSNQQQKQDLVEQGGDLPTIHKSLGPMLLSDGQRGGSGMAATVDNAPTAEDDDEPWDGMDVEEEGGLRSSTSSGLRPHALGEGVDMRRGASAPSWDSASYRHSPPSPATSPSVSPSSRQREKTNPESDQPLSVGFGDDNADTTVGPSGTGRSGEPSLLVQPSTPSRVDVSARDPSEIPAQAAAQSSLPLGQANAGSFGVRRASLGRHTSPPAILRLSPSMQEIVSTPPRPIKKESAMSSIDTGMSSSVSFRSAMTSPLMTGARKSSAPLFSGRKFSLGDASGSLPGSAKKSEPSPIAGRTSFSMDRDRSPVASPYTNHAPMSSPSGKGLRGAFAKLGISSSINSGLSSHAMKSMGSTISNGSTGSYGASHMKKGISSESYPFTAFNEETRPEWGPSPFEESRTSNGRPDMQWSHTSRSTSSGNLTGHDSSLSAAQEATQMLQVETEALQPTPAATPSTLTAPGRRSSGSLSPSFRGPSMDSQMSRGNSSSHVHPSLQAASIYGTATTSSTSMMPTRPPRSRPLPGSEGRGTSPTTSHPHRQEGTSSSAGSHTAPTPSPRAQESHDVTALDAMLRAQKAREEEMFKGIMARNRTRTRTEEARCQGAHSPYLLSPNALSDGRSSAFL
ncbi:hypothetical protein BCV69DRAFT_142479 [Microstroma glucosiphilum]|uniref:Uncharacterized protein n=1 Tax=Pseudomicrostroma glucosiphilum TaxID=1684307 RepID=A0A316UB42_9BASI|nr:hypothetical protein BCV69DRAFT_142479 [Pseudomicrostroma glucosiphilum]PWN22382.1 hypothetical protein BCV69DRAFT_142479 [Pseudomicrostroma glucosiphilum]